MDSNETPSGVDASELVCSRCENYPSESIEWWQFTSVSGLSDGTFTITTTNNNVVDAPFCSKFPDITLSGIKISIPTQNPTSKPTSNPSHVPSAEPTAPPTWVTLCANTPCQCDESLPGFEDQNCHICHSNGCSQCKDVGTYWKLSYNHPCVNCKEIFGDGCMFCQDFNGCGQCTEGYTREYDSEAGLYYCS